MITDSDLIYAQRYVMFCADLFFLNCCLVQIKLDLSGTFGANQYQMTKKQTTFFVVFLQIFGADDVVCTRIYVRE